MSTGTVVVNPQGGLTYECQGIVESAKLSKPNKETGEQHPTCSLQFMGGRQYVKLETQHEMQQLKEGDFAVVRGRMNSFKDQMYPGPGRVVEIVRAGKPVPLTKP